MLPFTFTAIPTPPRSMTVCRMPRVAINIGASFTYYYLAPDAGTYFFHCHISPPEHLQMGMVGQIYVRPRQNRVPSGNSLYTALQTQQSDPRTACNSGSDILLQQPAAAVKHGCHGRGQVWPITTATAPLPMTSSIRSRSTDSIRISLRRHGRSTPKGLPT